LSEDKGLQFTVYGLQFTVYSLRFTVFSLRLISLRLFSSTVIQLWFCITVNRKQ